MISVAIVSSKHKKEFETRVTTETTVIDPEAQDELSHNFLDSLIYVMLPVSTNNSFLHIFENPKNSLYGI